MIYVLCIYWNKLPVSILLSVTFLYHLCNICWYTISNCFSYFVLFCPLKTWEMLLNIFYDLILIISLLFSGPFLLFFPCNQLLFLRNDKFMKKVYLKWYCNILALCQSWMIVTQLEQIPLIHINVYVLILTIQVKTAKYRFIKFLFWFLHLYSTRQINERL